MDKTLDRKEVLAEAKMILELYPTGLLELCWTCPMPVDGKACGECHKCRVRLAGFKEAGLVDPIEYAK